MSLKHNVDRLRTLLEVPGVGEARLPPQVSPTGRPLSPLQESRDFGPNPGDLRLFSFVPATATASPALVVALHGCGQDPVAYDIGTGWSALAERFGFALLMPGQTSANNANACFNWFDPADTTRDHGEALSIRSMIAAMVDRHGIDRARIFVTGLSAGGAMAGAMLATYPEMFAAGAIIAGLPYGLASNVRQALSLMMRPRPHSAAYLGHRVRRASAHRGPWPRISIWQGAADQTVHPANADELLKQWLDVHGLAAAPMSQSQVDGHGRQIWWDADGRTSVESNSIAGMAHGAPLGRADDGRAYGATGPFMLDAGISSTWHIASFFGLTRRVAIPLAATGEPAVIQPLITQTRDVGQAIGRALSAAGLIKR